MQRKEIERRWGLETKKMIIPTVKEVMEREGLSWEEAAEKCIIICGNIYRDNDIDCFRKINGHNLCNGCPKYPEESKQKIIGWLNWQEIRSKKF